MKNSKPLIGSALALGIVSLLAVHPARAGCGFVPPRLTPNAWNSAEAPHAALTPAVYWSEAGGRFWQAGDDRDRDEGIVGMWRFTMVTPTPSGVPMLVDDGYAQWHADGTEMQNSGFHAPKTSSFCMGVWKQTGPRTYRLNHFPLGWDATGDNPANPIQITMTVKLTDRNHFTGSFTLKIYTWDGTELINASGAPMATINGTISAERVTIDSKVPGSSE